MLEISSRLGPYEILAPLGAGGMGEVYRAKDTRLDREVAIKVLPEHLADDPQRLARFEREAKAVAALSHPNIVALYDCGKEQGRFFAVTELLEGETLRSRLAKGPLPWREAVQIAAAVADGLAAAHAKGIVHRDLKPENLFLTADGRVKVLDFGLARIMPVSAQSETSPYVPAQTDPGTVMGTVGYMSPEQVRGQPADAPSDLFSFGCVLYEMVTGRRAFQRETAAETMTAILHDDPPDPTDSGHAIPAELDRIMRQCLVKAVNQRLHSARDLALALRATATHPGLPSSAIRRGVEAVAVLPFDNVGGDPKTEYLSDGVADHLIISLLQARREGLKVRPFSSVSRYKRQAAAVATIGRELNVQLLVTGTLHLVGDDLWISVAVVDAKEDNQLWGKRYQGKLGSILDLQDQIARDVAANLRLRLTGEEEQRLTKRYTEDPEAYLLYREAMYHWNKFTVSGLETAIDYCRRALQKDPHYALVHVALAHSLMVLAAFYRPAKDAYAEAKQWVEKALALDPTIANAHTVLGVLRMYLDWDWQGAEHELQQAIGEYPFYGFCLAAQGRPHDALAAIRRSHPEGVLTPRQRAELAMAHNWLRQPDAALAEAQKALELDPTFPLAYVELGNACVQTGRLEEGIASLTKAAQSGPRSARITGTLGYLYAVSGKKQEAQRALDELTSGVYRCGHAFDAARIHAGLGDKDQAFHWLRRACDEREWSSFFLKVDPTLDRLRSDRRFEQLLRDIGLPPDSPSTLPPAASRRSSPLLTWLLAALVLAGLIGTAVYFLTRSSKGPDAGKREEAKAVQAIAVLPFVYPGDDPKLEMLSQTLAGHIIDCLGQMRRTDLKIRPFSSVSRYTRQRPDNPTIGQALNVRLIVTGTLLQRGESLAIMVEVLNARENYVISSKSYQGKRGATLDLDLQDQIVRNVAANLGLGLSDEEQRRLTRRRTADPEAYRLYREATYHLNKFTPAGLTAGIKSARRALDKDPNYALAHVALARCYILRGALYEGPKEKAFAEARLHADEALKLDPKLADAHAALAVPYLFRDWDWAAAERELKQAVALDPDVQLTWNIHGFVLAVKGRLAEALVSIRRGQELDPLSPGRRNELAMCYNWMRQYDRAIAEARAALELDPNFPLAYAELGLAYVEKGRQAPGMYEKAIAELKEGLGRGQKHPRNVGMVGYAYAMSGRKAEAQGVLEELKGLSQGRFAFALPIARIHAALGEKDEAIKWLKKALDERDSGVVWLKVDPTMDSLRSDPRFAQILKDMGLPP